MRTVIPRLLRSSLRWSCLEKLWNIFRWPQGRAGPGIFSETRSLMLPHPPVLFLVAAPGFTWMLSRWKWGWCDPAGLVKVKLATTWLGDGPQAAVCRGLSLSQACVQMTLLKVKTSISGDQWWFSALLKIWDSISHAEISMPFHIQNISYTPPTPNYRFEGKNVKQTDGFTFRNIQFVIVWINKRSIVWINQSVDFLAGYVPSNWYSLKLTCVYSKCSCCMKSASTTAAMMFLVMAGNAAYSVLLFGVWSPLKWLHKFKNKSIYFYECL